MWALLALRGVPGLLRHILVGWAEISHLPNVILIVRLQALLPIQKKCYIG